MAKGKVRTFSSARGVPGRGVCGREAPPRPLSLYDGVLVPDEEEGNVNAGMSSVELLFFVMSGRVSVLGDGVLTISEACGASGGRVVGSWEAWLRALLVVKC